MRANARGWLLALWHSYGRNDANAKEHSILRRYSCIHFLVMSVNIYMDIYMDITPCGALHRAGQ